jgi:hypothetical protein
LKNAPTPKAYHLLRLLSEAEEFIDFGYRFGTLFSIVKKIDFSPLQDDFVKHPGESPVILP